MNNVETIRNFLDTIRCIRQRGSTSLSVAGIKSVPVHAILIVRHEQEARRIIEQYKLQPDKVRSFQTGNGDGLRGIDAPILIDKDAVEVMLVTLLNEIDSLRSSIEDNARFEYTLVRINNLLASDLESHKMRTWSLIEENIKLNKEIDKLNVEVARLDNENRDLKEKNIELADKLRKINSISGQQLW